MLRTDIPAEIRERILHDKEIISTMAPSSLAHTYGILAHRLPFSYCQSIMLKGLLDRELPEDVEAILEVGAGSGYVYHALLPTKLRKKWCQLELNSSLSGSAKHAHPNANIVCGCAYEIPFEDETFDVIFGYSGYSQINFLQIALEEAKRCLKKGGKFIHIQDLGPCASGMRYYMKHSLGPRNLEVLTDGPLSCITSDGKVIDKYEEFSLRLLEAAILAGLDPTFNSILIGDETRIRPGAKALSRKIDTLFFNLGVHNLPDAELILKACEEWRDEIVEIVPDSESCYHIWDRGVITSDYSALGQLWALGIPEELFGTLIKSEEELMSSGQVQLFAASNAFVAQKP